MASERVCHMPRHVSQALLLHRQLHGPQTLPEVFHEAIGSLGLFLLGFKAFKRHFRFILDGGGLGPPSLSGSKEAQEDLEIH